jgi:undecaprenyl diphosphate synthase
VARTAKGSRPLAVALNYGSQQEIARAAAEAAAEGPVTVETIAAHLDTADLPPLDLLVRTSGEVRLSNFLLWQAAYAEMWFTEVLWPDFTLAHLQEALASFAGRERRYGGR